MKHDSPSSVGDEIPARDAVAAMLGIASKLDQISERLTRVANQDRDTRVNRYDERCRPLAPDRPFANILASVETSELRAANNFTKFGDRLDLLGPKFERGLDGFLRNTENGLGERLLETAAQNNIGYIEVSEGRADDSLKAEQESSDQCRLLVDGIDRERSPACPGDHSSGEPCRRSREPACRP